MMRLGLAFGILLGAVGCGPVGGMCGGGTTEARAPFGLRGFGGGSHGEGEAPAGWEPAVETGRWDNRTELTDTTLRSSSLRSTSAAPDCVRVPEATLGFSRVGGGRGYVWIGYTVADFGEDDLHDVGRGDGFTFGGGFKLGESGHTFFEFAWEKSLKHEVEPEITTEGKALHERLLGGFRTTTAPRARLQNQPRPYVSYGLGYNLMQVRYDDGTGSIIGRIANGVGTYLGLGCEFPSEGRGAFSFDAKFHTWSENFRAWDGSGTSTCSTIAFSLLWMNRF